MVPVLVLAGEGEVCLIGAVVTCGVDDVVEAMAVAEALVPGCPGTEPCPDAGRIGFGGPLVPECSKW